MARRSISLDEKIEKAEAAMLAAKAKERNAELSRKSKIVRTGSTETRDKNVTGLREVSFRPVYICSAIKKAFYLCAVQRNP